MIKVVSSDLVEKDNVGLIAIDDNFYLVDTDICTNKAVLLHSFDIETFAEMSFQSYDKEEEMEQYFKAIMTQEKLREVFNCDNPKKEFENIIKETFNIENEQHNTIDLNDPRIMSSAEACEQWGIDDSTLRKAHNRFPIGSIRKFGRDWVVTDFGMNQVFGRRKEDNGK
ncbi:helix-turn-helix domain-containing protein [Paenibacillus naphthalenovorans]|uniref:Helix-turn-helix domain-containing protein n=1 Tax=Paenibacillus naphthalenovorans TaxID=162209 RepID=A0A0U2W140_9BACL|nr:helix-turn-helix domain-containing protein [Paenibacillus naphthalenovorans]ALS22260.1 hypothetical protein IJ22_18860 [Paenibacillus naphthalenovorans]